MFWTNAMKSLYIFLYIAPFAVIRYYPFRDKLRVTIKKLCLIYAGLLTIQAACFCFLFNQPFWDDTFIQIFRLGFILVYAILSFVMIKDNFFKQFYIWGLVLAFAGCIMANANFLEVIVHQKIASLYPYMVANIVIILQIVLFFPIAIKIISKKLMPVIDPECNPMWYMFALIPLLIDTQSLLSTWSISSNKVSSLSYLANRHITFYSMLLVTFVLCETFRQSASNIRLSETAQMAEWLLTEERERFHILTEHIEETKRARHDLRHHYSIIHAYLEKDSKEKLQEYINQCQLTLMEEAAISLCSNYAVDVIVCYYQELSKKEGVHFDVNLRLPNKMNIADADLTIIFGNLLENALEACKRQTSDNKFITVNALLAGKSVVITVDNSCEGDIRKDNLGYLSAKREGRGIGLTSVQAAVVKYNGVSSFDCSENIFRASVMLMPC